MTTIDEVVAALEDLLKEVRQIKKDVRKNYSLMVAENCAQKALWRYRGELQVGDTVKYASPKEGEDGYRFTLVEINGDRCLCELLCDWTVRPVETLMLKDIVKAE